MARRMTRKAIAVISLVVLLIVFVSPSLAEAAVRVRGYYRKNGTYVQPHYRSNPDGNPYNNWSYPGNVNPYTGKVAPGDPETYLRDYYHGSTPAAPPVIPAQPCLPSLKPSGPASPPAATPPALMPASSGQEAMSERPRIVSGVVCTATVNDAWSTAKPVSILGSSVRTVGVRMCLSEPASAPVECRWLRMQAGNVVEMAKTVNEETGYGLYYFTITFTPDFPAIAGQWKVEARTGSSSFSMPFFIAPSELGNKRSVVVEDKELEGDVLVFFVDDEAYVRVSALAQATGFTSEWLQSLELLILRSRQRELVLKAGWIKAMVDGAETTLASAPMKVNDELYIPIGTIQPLFSRKATLDAKSGVVTISRVEIAVGAPK